MHFSDAKAYCESTKEMTMRDFSLSSLEQLKFSLESGDAISQGAEWISEGFIYDHALGRTTISPADNDVAFFRIIEILPR